MPTPVPVELAYRHRLLALQKAMGKTRADLRAALRNYLGILFATGVVLAGLIAFIVSPGDPVPAGGDAIGEFMRSHGISFKDLGQDLGIFLWPLAIAMLLGALAIPAGFVYALVMLTKTLVVSRAASEPASCPRCQAAHEILEHVRDYTCPKCNLPLRFSKPGLVTLLCCPYCVAEFAVTSGSTEASCPCCEVTLAVSGASCSVRGELACCVACAAPMPASAAFCASCFHTPDQASLADFEGETKRAFREDSFDGFAHSSETAGKAAAALLARNGMGTLADARRRVARAAATIDPKEVLAYVDSANTDFACLQLIDALATDRLRGPVAAVLAEADSVHATYARALMEAAKSGGVMFRNIETVEQLARSYLHLRSRVVDALTSTDQSLAARFKQIEMEARQGSGPAASSISNKREGRRFVLKYKAKAGAPSLVWVIDNPDVLAELAAALEEHQASV